MFVCRVCVEQNVYLEVRLNTQLLHQYRKFCVLKKSTLQKFDALLLCHIPIFVFRGSIQEVENLGLNIMISKYFSFDKKTAIWTWNFW